MSANFTIPSDDAPVVYMVQLTTKSGKMNSLIIDNRARANPVIGCNLPQQFSTFCIQAIELLISCPNIKFLTIVNRGGEVLASAPLRFLHFKLPLQHTISFVQAIHPSAIGAKKYLTTLYNHSRINGSISQEIPGNTIGFRFARQVYRINISLHRSLKDLITRNHRLRQGIDIANVEIP